ncbi:MAG: glycosyltransferase [Gammaproteobacteria bacterium]|nr:glycosyltransferase [Gammaproteobacteria bacterium]
MIGVVVPAHNEQDLLGSCLDSLVRAANHPDLLGEAVHIVVVLDACVDRSADIAAQRPVLAISMNVCNVGMARAAGAEMLLASGARWLAFTDADSEVAPDWLAAQTALNADVVCGVVTVTAWRLLPRIVRTLFEANYVSADGHRHIHGANLGMRAEFYQKVGGFAPLCAHEDVHLVRALEAAGADIAWSAAPQVVTSARLDSRAPEGFGQQLRLWASAIV